MIRKHNWEPYVYEDEKEKDEKYAEILAEAITGAEPGSADPNGEITQKEINQIEKKQARGEFISPIEAGLLRLHRRSLEMKAPEREIEEDLYDSASKDFGKDTQGKPLKLRLRKAKFPADDEEQKAISEDKEKKIAESVKNEPVPAPENLPVAAKDIELPESELKEEKKPRPPKPAIEFVEISEEGENKGYKKLNPEDKLNAESFNNTDSKTEDQIKELYKELSRLAKEKKPSKESNELRISIKNSLDKLKKPIIRVRGWKDAGSYFEDIKTKAKKEVRERSARPVREKITEPAKRRRPETKEAEKTEQELKQERIDRGKELLAKYGITTKEQLEEYKKKILNKEE